MRSTLGISIVLFSLLTAVESTCYFPNGDSIQDTPCNPDAAHSTCCGPGYACLSNNVCALTEHASSDVAKLSSYYVRASCTDSTWKSKECPLFCLNSANGDNLGVGGMGVGKCDGNGGSDRYYCRNSKLADMTNQEICKDDSKNYFEFSGFPSTVTIIGVDPTPSSKPSPSSSSESVISPTPIASQSPAPTASPASQDNSKVALGAGLGVGLGVPLLIALGLLVFMALRRHGRHSQTSELDANVLLNRAEPKDDGTSRTSSPQWTMHRYPQTVHEITGGEIIHEVPSSPVKTHEMSVKGY